MHTVEDLGETQRGAYDLGERVGLRGARLLGEKMVRNDLKKNKIEKLKSMRESHVFTPKNVRPNHVFRCKNVRRSHTFNFVNFYFF